MKFTKIITLLLLSFLFSCHAYRQNMMFKTEKGADYLVENVVKAEENYVIRVNDYIELNVYTNDGELIIDPNYALRSEIGNTRVSNTMETPKYLVQVDGYSDLPMIGKVKLDGLTLAQAKELLEEKYAAFYEKPYVYVKLISKRVIVLGAMGGQVIPLENENINLLEIIALAGGPDNYAKMFNIRLIRGDFQNPQVYEIDLSTIEGMQKANMQVKPNDVIYVEPVRKVVQETARDITPLIAVITSMLTLYVLLTRE